jgi:hypothetical protein
MGSAICAGSSKKLIVLAIVERGCHLAFPPYVSPQVDVGYDVHRIDPAYGTIDDFKELSAWASSTRIPSTWTWYSITLPIKTIGLFSHV